MRRPKLPATPDRAATPDQIRVAINRLTLRMSRELGGQATLDLLEAELLALEAQLPSVDLTKSRRPRPG